MPNQQNEEFRLLLKSLHLEMKQLADFWGIGLRSVQRWAEGRQALPNARRETLLEWQRWADETANAFFKSWGKQNLKSEEITLRIFNQFSFETAFCKTIPTQVHQSAMSRAKFLLDSEGYKTRVVRDHLLCDPNPHKQD